jgi:phosphoribosylglycinamide formyltransferase-1
VSPTRIAVLASGSGTLLDAIIADEIPLVLAVTDRPCRALNVAKSRGVAAELLERTDWSRDFDRDGYTERLVKLLASYGVDVVVMAGFGTVVPRIVDAFPNRVLNSHPALLPSFKGWHAVRAALDYGVKVTGTTIHVVTAETDEGPILAQRAVDVLPDDDEASLHERIKEVERELYPRTIRRYVEQLDQSDPHEETK